jgi:hypothetical protein
MSGTQHCAPLSLKLRLLKQSIVIVQILNYSPLPLGSYCSSLVQHERSKSTRDVEMERHSLTLGSSIVTCYRSPWEI